MSIQQGFYRLCVAVMLVLFAPSLPANHAQARLVLDEQIQHDSFRPTRSEEITLSTLEGLPEELVLSETRRELRIPFTIAPNARPESIDLLMSAIPQSDRSTGRLEVFVNRSRAVELQPRAQSFEARFSLYSDDLRAGDNVLIIRLIGSTPTGWRINHDASRLRVSVAPAEGYSALSEIEAALEADFAAPRRVYLNTEEAGQDALAISALVAQGLALRMGEAPIIVRDQSVAELTVSADVRDGAATPAIDLTGPSEIRLSAGNDSALIAAARLFAARKMDHHALRFDMASAMTAERLDHTPTNLDAGGSLQDLAKGGAPFGSDQGGRAAVVIAGDDEEARAASLAVVARAALASGSAWIYAWYGDTVDEAPLNHNLLVLGPQQAMDPRLMAIAPVEVRAAAAAAANRAPRIRPFYGSAAYASDGNERAALITGFAALFEESSGRKVALITAPEGADFARAAKRLARSGGLWSSLEGHAVVWDASTVTPFGPSSAPRFSAEWASTVVRENDEWLALGAFILAVLLLMTGQAVNRTSRRQV